MAFYSRLNKLLALINRAKHYYIASEDIVDLNTRVVTTQKSFTKDVEALLRISAKHGLRQRLKGEDFPLL